MYKDQDESIHAKVYSHAYTGNFDTGGLLDLTRTTGFNKWSYYHKIRKLLKRAKKAYKKEPLYDGSIARLEARITHYVELCIDPKLILENDTSNLIHDIDAWRANTRYRYWYDKHKFHVGQVIKITKHHGFLVKDEYGVGESVRVTSVINYPGGGFQHITVQRISDGYVRTYGTVDNGNPATYDSSHFLQDCRCPREGYTSMEMKLDESDCQPYRMFSDRDEDPYPDVWDM